jgi:hypothetical protein
MLEKFWIIARREAVREYISLCTKCKQKNFRGASQMMANYLLQELKCQSHYEPSHIKR